MAVIYRLEPQGVTHRRARYGPAALRAGEPRMRKKFGTRLAGTLGRFVQHAQNATRNRDVDALGCALELAQIDARYCPVPPGSESIPRRD
jgi:hypothetical protein